MAFWGKFTSKQVEILAAKGYSSKEICQIANDKKKLEEILTAEELES